MADYNEFMLFQKIYDLTLWMYPQINKFPKNQRFVLGQRIENTLIRLIEMAIEFSSGVKKREYLIKKISVELDKLRILIRLSKDLNFFKKRTFFFVSGKVDEIGQIIGGIKKMLKLDKG